MSVVSMQKMSLVAHTSERTKLLRIFIKAGCVELIKTEQSVVVTNADRERKEKNETRKFRAAFCLSFLKEMSKEIQAIDKKQMPKINLKKENRLIKLEEYEEVCNNTEELNDKIDEMEEINNRITDLRSEKTRLNAFIEQLMPYAGLGIDISKVQSSKEVSVFLGLIPIEKKETFLEKIGTSVVYKLSEYEKSDAIFVLCHKCKEKEVSELLTECEFVKSSLNFDGTVQNKIEETKERIQEIDKTVSEIILSTVKYVKYIPTVKIVYDYCNLELAKLDITENSARTKKAIAFEGWVPAEKVEELTNTIKEKCKRVVMTVRDPFEDEIPPTEVKNNKVVGAFEGITEMFGRPNYREKDPNLFVALFYFLIFGIMIGDAGYGLIMTIACFAFLLIFKPVKKSGRMMLMFAFCGISTVIWGTLFGGWFAIEIPKTSFLAKLTWFNPLEEPLKMFMLALGIGVIQIGTGFVLNGIARIKSGHIMEGILSDFGWTIILIGVLLVSPKIMLFINAIQDSQPWFDTMSKVGMYFAIVGAVMMVIGGAWGKKNPVKMVGGAFQSVYGAINIVSDLLSYSRLFGLGLTTGVIGLVMNKLGMIFVDKIGPAGWIFAVIIFIGGHVFNLAINLLGAYVHDCRLQYIEFFGRFYEGSGRAFKPIGYDMKYTFLDN